MYNQKWYSDINNSSRLQSYSIFKHNFTLEKSLKISMENKYKYALSRFRTSSHDLLIETGRYENIPRDQRLCKYCDVKKIESEYHFLLVCRKFRDLRKNILNHIIVIGQQSTNLRVSCLQIQRKLFAIYLSIFILLKKLEFHDVENSWREQSKKKSKKSTYVIYTTLVYKDIAGYIPEDPWGQLEVKFVSMRYP